MLKMQTLSIITVNYNNYKGLLATLESVRMQTCQPFEHWVLDGGSNDMEQDFVALEKTFDFKFVSEPDRGIYHAMNKGITKSSGSHLLFLNSGDTFVDKDSLSVIWNQNLTEDLYYANVYQVDDIESKITTYPRHLDLDYMSCYGLPHQATIIRKELFDQVGFYDETYKIISDWVFFMEVLFAHKATYGMTEDAVVLYDRTGVSSQHQNTKSIVAEQVDYINHRFPDLLKHYKLNSPYVKKYFRRMPRWQRFIKQFLFNQFNIV
jgi:glycosyltransferase involved in cell wall biosynthesis